MSITVTKKTPASTTSPQPAAAKPAAPVGKAGLLNAAKAGGVPNYSPFHAGAGVPDPLFRTWWYFSHATGATDTGAAVDSSVAKAMTHVQLMFGDGQERIMDRMPRRSARMPVVKFMCYHTGENKMFQPLGDYQGVPPAVYAITVDSMSVAENAHPVSAAGEQQQPVVHLIKAGAKVTKQEFTGTLTFDSKAAIPDNYKRKAHLPIKPPAGFDQKQYDKDHAEVVGKAMACKDAVTMSKDKTITVCKFALHRASAGNTLEITHPSGVTYHFTTNDVVPIESAKATPTVSSAATPAPKKK